MRNEKQAYREKEDAELREWDAKADLLKAKANNLSADARMEFDKQMNSLQENKSEIGAYVDKLSDKADDAWDDIKDEAEEKWDKFSSSVSKFVSKYT
jgi:hypothetical protein